MKHPAFAFAALTLSLAACTDPAPESPAEPPEVQAEEAEATPVPQTVRTPDPELEASAAQDEARADGGALQATIPAQFHGRWAESAAACDDRNHQQYHIEATQVGFFESSGIVQNVRAEGDYAAATLSEQYGDAPASIYVFYMALEGVDTMRVRYDSEPRFRLVRCPE